MISRGPSADAMYFAASRPRRASSGASEAGLTGSSRSFLPASFATGMFMSRHGTRRSICVRLLHGVREANQHLLARMARSGAALHVSATFGRGRCVVDFPAWKEALDVDAYRPVP
jgi:hypothetical protein